MIVLLKSIESILSNVRLMSKMSYIYITEYYFCIKTRAQLIFRNALMESELELRVIRSMTKSLTPFYLNNKSEINHNARCLEKIIKITLTKGNDGLGFKLASRDNPTGMANPIYVKTIFLKGAAIEDGRLHNGDRLLSVNFIDVTQMSLQETVGLLRGTKIGDTVHLCVSRQCDRSLPKDLVRLCLFLFSYLNLTVTYRSMMK